MADRTLSVWYLMPTCLSCPICYLQSWLLRQVAAPQLLQLWGLLWDEPPSVPGHYALGPVLQEAPVLGTLIPGMPCSLIICLSTWVFWTSQCSGKYREFLFRLGGARASWPQPPASYTAIEYPSVSAGSSLSLRRPVGLRPSLLPPAGTAKEPILTASLSFSSNCCSTS